MQMQKQEGVLFNKDGIEIKKQGEGQFEINFYMENRNVVLQNVINFDFFKLIHDLNKDICENVELLKLNENSAIITILVKNFFEDLGISQKFACFQVNKEVNSSNNQITFTFKTCANYKPTWLDNKDIELAYIDQIHLSCMPLSPHHVQFYCFIQFPNNKDIPAYVQKMSVMIVQKIINRLKQFIESVKIYI